MGSMSHMTHTVESNERHESPAQLAFSILTQSRRPHPEMVSPTVGGPSSDPDKLPQTHLI